MAEAVEALVPLVTFIETPDGAEGVNWKELLFGAINAYDPAIAAFAEATTIALETGETSCANVIADFRSVLARHTFEVSDTIPKAAASGESVRRAFGPVFYDTIREVEVQLPVLVTRCASLWVED